jgi:predicted HicB family RNase H-like nuclease
LGAVYSIFKPERDPDRQDYSGRFVLRMPKFLHRELVQSARKNSVSLNQYVCALLAMNFQPDQTAGASDVVREDTQ